MFKPYEQYKPSGVEWLGEVPEHWDTWKATHGFRRIGSGTTPKSDDAKYYDGDIPWVTTSELRETVILDTAAKVTETALQDYSALRLYPKGTLLFAMYGATIGRLGILGIAATVNQACAALAEPLRLDTRFTYYWLQMRRPTLIVLSAGGGQPNLSQDDLRQLRVPAPPLVEQRAIADFLDRETAKIDTLVTKKQTLIEKLKEKRTALISRTVTRGLPPDAARAAGIDPHPRLKPSGIEWLGDVPEHWKPKRLRFVSPHITVGIVVEPSKYYEDSGVPCLRSLNVRPNELLDRDLVYISHESHRILSKSMVKKGDLVAVRSGQPGTTAVIDDRFDGTNCIDLIIIRKPTNGNSAYISYFLNSLPAQAQFTGGAGGAIQQHFNITTASDLWLIEPPSDEQDAIADYLDRETAKIDQMIDKVEAAIERLQEYRTALITAAVTGKIDVRGATA